MYCVPFKGSASLILSLPFVLPFNPMDARYKLSGMTKGEFTKSSTRLKVVHLQLEFTFT